MTISNFKMKKNCYKLIFSEYMSHLACISLGEKSTDEKLICFGGVAAVGNDGVAQYTAAQCCHYFTFENLLKKI